MGSRSVSKLYCPQRQLPVCFKINPFYLSNRELQTITEILEIPENIDFCFEIQPN
jgi:hypothetical protein|tara:strand:- start:112 stop:276 length:165 start_codon:yes stop_codon:yes gene_type:complete